MLDEQSEENQERGSQLAVAVGLLLFASVVLGSGVLGDSGDALLSGGEEGADDADADPATDREQMANGAMDLRDAEADFSWEDCLGADRPMMFGDERPDAVPGQGIPDSSGEDQPREANQGMDRQNLDRDQSADRDPNSNPNTAAGTPATATGTALGTSANGVTTITIDRTDAATGVSVDDPCAGMRDSQVVWSIFGASGMHTGQALQSMFHQMCVSYAHGEFWGNIGGEVERAEDGSVSITTVSDDGTETTDTLSPATVRALTEGLAPIVDSCSDWMMMMAMTTMAQNAGGMGYGNGHGWDQGHGDWDHDWYDDCEDEDDWHDWESDEWDGEHDESDENEHDDESDEHNGDSDESDEHDSNGDDAADGHEDEPRQNSRHANGEDRRHGDWDPCADHHDWDEEWDHDWDEHDWEESEPLMVELWIATDEEGHGYWISFETYECAGVYDFVDDSGHGHSLEYDVCEDDYYAEEWYDEEANTWNAHWEDEDGTWWMVLNYDTCIGVLEWVDAEGEDGREEWEMEDCHDEEDESDEEECEHHNDHGECLDEEEESDEHGEDEHGEDESDDHGDDESDEHGDESDEESDDESDDESDEGSDGAGNGGTSGGHR